MATIFELVLTGPSGSVAVNQEVQKWCLLNDDLADLNGKLLLDADDGNIKMENISPAEIAGKLLEDLEKEDGVESTTQESFIFPESLQVFEDISKIPPVAGVVQTSTYILPDFNTHLDTSADFDFLSMLPETTPPNSPDQQQTYNELEELLWSIQQQTRVVPQEEALASNPVSINLLPPTPSTCSPPHSLKSSPAPSPFASPEHQQTYVEQVQFSPISLAPPSPSPSYSQISLPPSPSYSQASSLENSSQAAHENFPATPSSQSSPSSWDSDSMDPDWTPEENSPAPGPSHTVKAVRSKPYSRPQGRGRKSGGVPTDRRERKKEQNKNAATRYRLKKKAEEDVLLGEEEILEEQNSDLKGKVTDLENEIRIIKGLLRDHLKRRGLIQD